MTAQRFWNTILLSPRVVILRTSGWALRTWTLLHWTREIESLHRDYGGGPHDAFVVKFDMLSLRLIYSTYLGGDGDEHGNSIAVDAGGNAYVTGTTETPVERPSPPTDFPTEKPAQGENAGSFDGFVANLSPDGSALGYSTLLGGDGDDVGLGIAVDAAGNAYVTGFTEPTNFPLQVFLARLGFPADLSIAGTGPPPCGHRWWRLFCSGRRDGSCRWWLAAFGFARTGDSVS